MESFDLLQRIAKSWDTRSKVRSSKNVELSFDRDKEDFLIELLPFKDHPLFVNASPEMKSRILSCGWISYNAKTVAIETDVVHPVCLSILADDFSGATEPLIKQLITETLVDESYHIHLCMYGNLITKQERNIDVHLPTFAFIKHMQELQNNYSEAWKKSIIQLLTSIASEIFITDYLALVSKSESHSIQPINSWIVQAHRSDELVHGKIFTHLAKIIFNSLNQQQKEFFSEMMPKPIVWLSNMELDVWFATLQQLKFSDAAIVINDCKSIHDKQIYNGIYSNEGVADFVSLAEEIGVLDLEAGRDAFYREKLIQ